MSTHTIAEAATAFTPQSTLERLKGLTPIRTTVLLIAMLFALPSPAEAVTIDRESLNTIGAATFEVVIPKPSTDSLTYEKPLPFDLLPFKERNDPYFSVGTAFAIGSNTFVSAAHVFSLTSKSQLQNYYLRDAQGAIHEIKQIEKYSFGRDFIVFSLNEPLAKQHFSVNTDPVPNSIVYAVGNALGEGVIVRDGLYTSSTPEEDRGEWNWLRFSAAASPGNSGGPLLDEKGAVIGIVVRKSNNENLNYALPIAEVLNAKNVAHVYAKLIYHIDNMDMRKMSTLDRSLPLPLPLSDLRDRLTVLMTEAGDALMADFFAENDASIFPNGDGSGPLLRSSYSTVFPHLISKSETGVWDIYRPENIRKANLSNNGYIDYGSLGDSTFFYIKKPDNIPYREFLSNPGLQMDLILKAIYATRNIGMAKIRITSAGKPKSDSIFIDGYGRKWQVRVWDIEYNDSQVASFSLPTPGGNITLLRQQDTGATRGNIADLQKLTNFVYLSYYGTTAEWREYLSNADLLPDAFKNIEFSVESGKNFSFKSRLLTFSYGSDVMTINEESDFRLDFSYFLSNGEVVWDVVNVMAGENRRTGTFFQIERNQRPLHQMSENQKSAWDNMLQRRTPFNGMAYFSDKKTLIQHILQKNDDSTPAKSESEVLYLISYGENGSVDGGQMLSKLTTFTSGITRFE
jgi:hypothetical protein